MDLFVTDAERCNCVDIISSKKELHKNVRSMLSNKHSNQKRKARNKYFSGLIYHCLLSRSVVHTEEQRSANTRQTMGAIFKLLQSGWARVFAFVPWYFGVLWCSFCYWSRDCSWRASLIRGVGATNCRHVKGHVALYRWYSAYPRTAACAYLNRHVLFL